MKHPRDDLAHVLATALQEAQPARLALRLEEAAAVLGVSDDFFRQHVAPELRMVRRGRLRLISVKELRGWLGRSASVPLADELRGRG